MLSFGALRLQGGAEWQAWVHLQHEPVLAAWLEESALRVEQGGEEALAQQCLIKELAEDEIHFDWQTEVTGVTFNDLYY